MKYEVIQTYYKELKKSSLENAVDVMWANILPLYFKLELGYGIDAQPCMRDGKTKKIPDFAIRIVKNGQPKKVCLIEDKRVMHEGSAATWGEAFNQLTAYMVTARDSNTNPSETMYGIVTVGHYSRFYELLPSQDELCNLSDYDGSPLHFKKDEMQIDAMLQSLVNLTSCYEDGGDGDYEDGDYEGGDYEGGDYEGGDYECGDYQGYGC